MQLKKLKEIPDSAHNQSCFLQGKHHHLQQQSTTTTTTTTEEEEEEEETTWSHWWDSNHGDLDYKADNLDHWANWTDSFYWANMFKSFSHLTKIENI